MKSIIGKKISAIPQKIIVGGAFTSYDGTAQNYITRLNSDGTRDTEFTIGTGFSAELFATAVQSDGQILVGGNFTTYQGATANRIARLNSSEYLDYDFSLTTGAGASNTVRSIEIQSDGSIVIGGNFTSFAGTSANRIVRIFSSGFRDGGFTIGTGFNNVVRKVAIQSDGKIVVGGSFTAYNGTSRSRIIRLNSNGSIDTGFTIGTGFSAQVITIAIQPDGKILAGGSFIDYNGTTQNRITRLNSDGTRDTGFTTGSGFNGNVNAIAIQSDGKIVVGGSFTNYNGTTQNSITRLNSDGTRDSEFTTETGFSGNVNALAIQSDGKIVVGGTFSTYRGTSTLYICRLNSNGTIDTAFTTAIGIGFDYFVNSITLT